MRRLWAYSFAIFVGLGCAPFDGPNTGHPGDTSAVSPPIDPAQGHLDYERAYLIRISGQPVGRTVARQYSRPDGSLYVEDESFIRIERTGSHSRDTFESRSNSKAEYDANLEMLWSEDVEEEAGVTTTERVELEGSELVFHYEGPGRKDSERFALPEDYRSGLKVMRELVDAYEDTGEPQSVRYASFERATRRFTRTEVEIIGRADWSMGGEHFEGYELEAMDEDGALVRTIIDKDLVLMHSEIQGTFQIDWVERPPSDSELGGALSNEIAVVGRVPSWWQLASMTIRVTIEGDEADAKPLFESNNFHDVKREGEVYDMKLLATRGPGDLPRGPALPLKPPEDVSRFLAATAQVQSDDERIEELAERIVGDADRSMVAAARIVVWVARSLEKRAGNRGSATAVEVLEAGAGDCTEHAALSAALLRAAGIPARTVEGIVLVGDEEGNLMGVYHAWNEVWAGQWYGLDSTTGELGTTARYLAMGYAEPGMPSTASSVVRTFGRTKIEVLSHELLPSTADPASANRASQ